MTGLVAGIGVRAALGSAGGFLKSIPPKVWLALAIALVVLLGLWWHGHAIKKHDKALRIAVTAQINAKSQKLIDGLNSKNAELVATLRRKNDETARIIIHDAGTLRLSGPGKAQCRASLPVAARQSGSSDRPGGIATTQVPSDDRLAAVQWDWLVDTAEQADLNRAETLAWREWYAKLLAAWPKVDPNKP